MSIQEKVSTIQRGSRVVYEINGQKFNGIAMSAVTFGYNAALKLYSGFLNLVYLNENGESVKISATPLLGTEDDREFIAMASEEQAKKDARWHDSGVDNSDLIAEYMDRIKDNPRTIGWLPAMEGDSLAFDAAILWRGYAAALEDGAILAGIAIPRVASDSTRTTPPEPLPAPIQMENFTLKGADSEPESTVDPKSTGLFVVPMADLILLSNEIIRLDPALEASPDAVVPCATKLLASIHVLPFTTDLSPDQFRLHAASGDSNTTISPENLPPEVDQQLAEEQQKAKAEFDAAEAAGRGVTEQSVIDAGSGNPGTFSEDIPESLRFALGEKVHFTEASGNDPGPVYTISGGQWGNGGESPYFWTLEEMSGLFLGQNLESTANLPAGEAATGVLAAEGSTAS